MVDYKTFKKGYLNEWVDRSQAARKAAEELANKEVGPSLRDLHKNEINQDLVFVLAGHKVEFKDENEKKADGDIYFTYEEAVERFGKPDEYGWRLPTKEELEALIGKYPFEFNKGGKQGVFDNCLSLPAAGYRGCDGDVDYVGSGGYIWSSTFDGSDEAWILLFFNLGEVYMLNYFRCNGFSVRLVRDVK